MEDAAEALKARFESLNTAARGMVRLSFPFSSPWLDGAEGAAAIRPESMKDIGDMIALFEQDTPEMFQHFGRFYAWVPAVHGCLGCDFAETDQHGCAGIRIGKCKPGKIIQEVTA